jgi:hypothetical protein
MSTPAARRRSRIASRWRIRSVVVLVISVAACAGTTPASVLRWTPIADLSPFADGSVAAAIGFGQGLVAAGTVLEGKTVHAAAWTSTDGQTWTRSADDPSFGSAAQFVLLATSGSTLAGEGCNASPEGCGGPVLVWNSKDGRTWSAATITPTDKACTPSTTECNPADLIGGAFGFLWVGVDQSAGFPQKPADASVGTSQDGKVWAIQPLDPALKAATMGGVAEAAGGFVAVGETSDLAPVIWTSADGRAWTRTSPQGVAPSAELRSVAAGGPGLVAVGQDGSRAASWTSKDGSNWQEGPDAGSLAGGLMLQVLSTSAGLVALGTVNGTSTAWLSADGSTWTKLDPGSTFAGAKITAAGAVGPRLVLFGKTEAGHLVGAVGMP